MKYMKKAREQGGNLMGLMGLADAQTICFEII